MNLWRKIRGEQSPQADEIASPASLTPSFSDEGVLYPSVDEHVLAESPGENRLALAYLAQLGEEGYAERSGSSLLVPWARVYELQGSPEHEANIRLLALPEQREVRPVLTSSGGLSDDMFRVSIAKWETRDGTAIGTSLDRKGAAFTVGRETALLPEAAWKLLMAVHELHGDQQTSPGEKTNQLGWAKVRKLATLAHARLDGFLDRTVVVRPDCLRLKLNRQVVGDEQVIEVTPEFDDEPEDWLHSFDRYQQVQDKYSITSSDGGVTHVLVTPEVKAVLSEVRDMPGRRVSGAKASLFLKNPFACLGADAARVLDPDEYDESLEEAGIYFYHFAVRPQYADETRISTVELVLTAPAENEQPLVIDLRDPITMGHFVQEVGNTFSAQLPCVFWRGYELDMAGFKERDLSGLEQFHRDWTLQLSGQYLNNILNMAEYGDRVLGIGVAPRITSPYLQKTASENWLPEELLNELGLDGALLCKWDTANHDHFEQFVANIDLAHEKGEATVRLPGAELDLDLMVARRIASVWGEKFKRSSERGNDPPADKTVLLVAGNIEEVEHSNNRNSALRLGLAANADLPLSLLPTTTLREHQLKGVGWLQHLYGLSPNLTSGCVLADDMGLGKTLQLLTFVAWCIEQEPEGHPILIVAPVSLLDNWEREMRNFLLPKVADDVLKLYGAALAESRNPKHAIPPEVRARGIQNLLRFGWRQNKRVVLTTYETLRDQEFSLARQEWSVVICDEAQKIKNPAARVTQATKAINARFRIACTGTPVENSLTDLWCLYDWIEPGLLGSLSDFGRNFRRPIEDASDGAEQVLQQLRSIIEPQLLRRTKQDVAKDLPAKIEDRECKCLPMSVLQNRLYRSEIKGYHDKRMVQEHLGESNAAMLGLLHTLKLVCAHPHSVRPEGHPLEASPKLKWTIEKLRKIKRADEKVLIFTELRQIQLALQLAILDEFGFKPQVINGDTNASSERGPSRQKIIDLFQAQPGFGVIILSTTAVGFGVNVQEANHVIHFTRPWNPAKEDQATDRAYRIGQRRDVYVYYPTVVANGMTTFEQTLDQLLSRKRTLATDMLRGCGDIAANDFVAHL